MAYNVIIAVTYFIEMLISYGFFFQIGERKLKNINCIIVGTLLFESGALVDILLSNIIWLNTTYFILINILFGFICYRIKFTRIIFYSIILDIFNGALEFIAIFIISGITKTETTAYLDQINMLVLDVAISKTLYFLTCNILARFVKKEKTNIKFPISLYLYPIIIIASLLVFWSICANSDISNSQQIALAVISAALFFSVVILFIIYQHNIEKENELFLLQNEFDKIETDKSYYDILEKQNQELMIYAHDAKKHLSAIRELNDNPVIDDYVNTMSDALKAHSSSCHSGNHLLDVIINKYETECQIKNIKFSFDVKLCNLNFVNHYDLVAILNNLLDNAIEAAVNSKDAFVSLTTNYTNTYAVITISNSCDNSPIISDNKLITTKENKNKHGMGIRSVRKTLKKYDGDLEWEYDETDRLFTTTVMLLCK